MSFPAVFAEIVVLCPAAAKLEDTGSAFSCPVFSGLLSWCLYTAKCFQCVVRVGSTALFSAFPKCLFRLPSVSPLFSASPVCSSDTASLLGRCDALSKVVFPRLFCHLFLFTGIFGALFGNANFVGFSSLLIHTITARRQASHLCSFALSRTSLVLVTRSFLSSALPVRLVPFSEATSFFRLYGGCVPFPLLSAAFCRSV